MPDESAATEIILPPNSQSRFKVEIDNSIPELIEGISLYAPGAETQTYQLGEFPIDDNMYKNITAQVTVASQGSELTTPQGTYNFSVYAIEARLTPQRTDKRAEQGLPKFFDHEAVLRIRQRIASSLGMDIKDPESLNGPIKYEKDVIHGRCLYAPLKPKSNLSIGFEVELGLGNPDELNEGLQEINQTSLEERRNWERMMQAGVTIRTIAGGIKRLTGGDTIHFKDKDTLPQQLSDFAKVVKVVMEAVYAEIGLDPPNQSVLLESPIIEGHATSILRKSLQ